MLHKLLLKYGEDFTKSQEFIDIVGSHTPYFFSKKDSRMDLGSAKQYRHLINKFYENFEKVPHNIHQQIISFFIDKLKYFDLAPLLDKNYIVEDFIFSYPMLIQEEYRMNKFQGQSDPNFSFFNNLHVNKEGSYISTKLSFLINKSKFSISYFIFYGKVYLQYFNINDKINRQADIVLQFSFDEIDELLSFLNLHINGFILNSVYLNDFLKHDIDINLDKFEENYMLYKMLEV